MLTNMKVGARLGWGFGVILVFMAVIASVGVISLQKMNAEVKNITGYENTRTEQSTCMTDDQRMESIHLRSIVLARHANASKTELQQFRDLLAGSRKEYDEHLTTLKGMLAPDETAELAMLGELEAAAAGARRAHDEIIQMALENRVDEATASLFAGHAVGYRQKWVDLSVALIRHEAERTQEKNKVTDGIYTGMVKLIGLLGLAAIILSIVLAFILTRGITEPLKTSVHAADRIAAKDLTVDLSMYKDRGDEMGAMLQAFGKMADMLKAQMQEIMEGVSMLSSSSGEILASTTQVASSAAENATAISETTTTVEEVRQAAQLSSQKARNISENSQALARVSQNGLKAIDENSAAMNRIQAQMESIAKTIVNLGDQTQSIGGIIAAITDIADQCNLLAVNAGIEAAKAGEQGRGFTVVAQELRSLAEQSKQGTAEVRRILNDVQKATNSAILVTEQGSNTVEAGVRQAALAGEAIRALAESTSQAVQSTIQIAASSQQQGIGMDQIGKAMENVSQATTQNMASMKQTEAAAKNINELGQKLKHLVSLYKL